MDMLERATSALQKAWDEGGVDGSMLPPFTFTDAEAKYLVCSILTAIREPSDDVSLAGVCQSPYRWEEGRETVDAIWQAMIDAILRDQ